MSEFMQEITPLSTEGDSAENNTPKSGVVTLSLNRQTVLNVLLGLLIVAAAFQAYVLYGLQGKVKGGFNLAPAASANSSAPAGLPSMVGGC